MPKSACWAEREDCIISTECQIPTDFNIWVFTDPPSHTHYAARTFLRDPAAGAARTEAALLLSAMSLTRRARWAEQTADCRTPKVKDKKENIPRDLKGWN